MDCLAKKRYAWSIPEKTIRDGGFWKNTPFVREEPIIIGWDYLTSYDHG
jgi:hypothetical protein